jgi:hypothetical protein
MAQVSPEQIARAKEVNILDYLMAREPDNLIRKGPNRHILREHDSFVITNDKWYWNSRHFGCETGTALNYLTEVRGMEFTDAVRLLAGDDDVHIPKRAKPPPAQKKPFRLPPRNRDNTRVSAYLQSRGIRRDVIEDCIGAGILYESAITHYCVFTGRNAEGKTRFACYRSTSGRYRLDEDGSDKRYGFLMPPQDPESRNIAAFESPIDALSHKSLCLDGYISYDGWRLALGGGSLLALTFFLERHPLVTNCMVCTDNDEAGDIAAEKIKALPREDSRFSSVQVTRAPPPYGLDYNETLQAIRKMERGHNAARREAELSL